MTDAPTDVDGPPTGPPTGRPAGPGRTPPRPPIAALVVVGLVGLAILGLFLRSAGGSTASMTASMLDEDESIVGPGRVALDLGDGALVGRLESEWIQRERCPGWVQFNSLDGDATTLHVIATTGAPDVADERLVPVTDYLEWLEREAGLVVADARPTTLLGQPAVRGRLTAVPDAPEDALVAACAPSDGGSGIRGPAAGFDQELVVTRAPVEGLGTVLVLGAAWVGGDVDLAAREARGLAESLRRE